MFLAGMGLGFLLGFVVADIAWRYVNRLRDEIETLQDECDELDAALNAMRMEAR